jgi:FkbM family methyltransferase
MPVKDLIIDVGAHKGSDTDFYLKKGFRVVAIEANPCLVEELEKRFRSEIDAGRLVLLPYGIHEQAGTFDFYRNLDKDDWSSFKPEFGTREQTKYDVCKVKCVPFEDVIRTYGVPYYLKTDIEGHDSHVLNALVRVQAAPTYLSVEGHSLDYLFKLRTLGYGGFKYVNQARNVQVKCPYPPLVGNYVDYYFDGHASGPFGEESPGDWQTFDAVAYEFLHVHFGFFERTTFGQGEGWHDFHAKFGEVVTAAAPRGSALGKAEESGSWLPKMVRRLTRRAGRVPRASVGRR